MFTERALHSLFEVGSFVVAGGSSKKPRGGIAVSLVDSTRHVPPDVPPRPRPAGPARVARATTVPRHASLPGHRAVASTAVLPLHAASEYWSVHLGESSAKLFDC